MDISLSYTISWDDFIDSQITYNRNSSEVKKAIKKTRIGLASFYSFILLVTYPSLNGPIRIIVLSMLFAIGAAHIVSVTRLNEMQVRKLARKVTNEANIDKLVGAKKLAISGNEIIYKEKAKTTKIDIENINRILESSVNYFIYVDETSAIILPKNRENGDDSQVKIIEHIKSVMAKKQRGVTIQT